MGKMLVTHTGVHRNFKINLRFPNAGKSNSRQESAELSDLSCRWDKVRKDKPGDQTDHLDFTPNKGHTWPAQLLTHVGESCWSRSTRNTHLTLHLSIIALTCANTNGNKESCPHARSCTRCDNVCRSGTAFR